jgi:hypothetical protein
MRDATRQHPAIAPPLTLSDYRIISPARVHPEAAQVEQAVTKLCKELGIYLPQYRDYTTMSMYLYPTTSMERLIAIQLFMNMLWYLDDHYDRDTVAETVQDKARRQKLYADCVKILREGMQPDDEHKLYDVFGELRRRMIEQTSEAWLRRLTDSLIEHMQASVANQEAFLSEDRIDLDSYMHARELDSGMRPTIYMLEFARDIFLPEDVLKHPYLQRMNLATSRIGSLTNDIFSYHKEVRELGSYYNLLRVLMETKGLALEEAVHESVALINDFIDEFIRDAENMPGWSDAATEQAVREYIEGLRDIVSASWHWQISTNRYRSPDSPIPELRRLLPD